MLWEGYYLVFSSTSWQAKNKNNHYFIVHNIWHIYMGIIGYYIIYSEKPVFFPFINKIYLTIFMGFLLKQNNKKIITYSNES